MVVRDTSIQCYNELISEGLLSSRQVQVYQALLYNKGSTDKQISEICKLPINSITGRRHELEEMGLVNSIGKIEDTKTNRTVNSWAINTNPDYKTAKKIAIERGSRIRCPCCDGKGYIVNGQIKLMW
jgi:predicted methyltransferase